MADEENESTTEEEDITDGAHVAGPDGRSGYDLRLRVTTREQERSHQASPLFQTVIEGRLGAQSADLIAHWRQTLTDLFERLLSTPRKTVASALDGGQHRRSEYDVRGTRIAVDANDEPYFYTDPCSLLAGKHEPHTDRSEPETRKRDVAHAADKHRSDRSGRPARIAQ